MSQATKTAYELHPLCTLFPRIVNAEFVALCNDIKANGLRQPIIVHDGMILDGGNRYRACLQVGVEPRFEAFSGGSLVGFVLSANLHRRHMSPGQQAAIVASAQDWAKAQAHGGDRKSDQAATLPVDTVADRAAQSGASERTQRMADKVAKADPALAKKVAHGEVSLPKAVKQIEQKPEAAVSVVDEPERDGPSESEIAAMEAAEAADREFLAELLDSDDKLAAAVKEVERLNALVAGMQQRINGLMNEKAEAISQAKKEMARADRLQKRLNAQNGGAQ